MNLLSSERLAHTRSCALRRVGACVAVLCMAPVALSGPLDPPAGPINPTGKTLVEVEPRIAVNSVNTPGDASSTFRITQSGSYYLTGNIVGQAAKHGITISSADVTLDLSGFALVGGANSLNGINVPGFTEGIVIRNGTVRGWTQSGIEAAIDSGAVENIVARRNSQWGIRVSTGSFGATIMNCSAFQNGLSIVPGGGILASGAAVMTNCRSTHNQGVGFELSGGSSVSNSVARSNSSHGFIVSNSVATNIASTQNGGEGVRLSLGSLLHASVVTGNTGAGVNSLGGSTIRENIVSFNGAGGSGAPGIILTNGINRVERNTVATNNGIGVHAPSNGNIIIGNTTRSNGTNWNIAANNVCLVVNATFTPAFSGNSGGVSPGSTDPNANFNY